MSPDNKFALADFNGDQLLTMFDGATIRVAMKPLVEALGISWPRQLQKIKSDPVMAEGVALTAIPSEHGAQETVTLPIDLMQGWLFKINPDKVSEHARPKVIAYQRECYQVLHDYWVKGAAINPRMAANGAGSSAEVLALMTALKKETNLAAQQVIHAMLVNACERVQIEAPALSDLAGHDVELWRETKDRFDASIRMFDGMGLTINQHRKVDQYFAINLPAYVALCRKHKFDLPKEADLIAMFRRHPDFLHCASVNCIDGEYRHCWVFKIGQNGVVPHAKRLV